MLHTTDAEMKGGSSGVRQLQPIRRLFEFCGVQLGQPSKAFTDNAAVHTIVESSRMTPRCRHIDIPIAFMHQEHNKSYKLDLIRTMVMLADFGTKANTPKLHQQFKYSKKFSLSLLFVIPRLTPCRTTRVSMALPDIALWLFRQAFVLHVCVPAVIHIYVPLEFIRFFHIHPQWYHRLIHLHRHIAQPRCDL